MAMMTSRVQELKITSEANNLVRLFHLALEKLLWNHYFADKVLQLFNNNSLRLMNSFRS